MTLVNKPETQQAIQNALESKRLKVEDFKMYVIRDVCVISYIESLPTLIYTSSTFRLVHYINTHLG